MIKLNLKYLDSLINQVFKSLEVELTQTIKNEILEYQKREFDHVRNVKTFVERYTPVDFLTVYYPLKLHKYNSRYSYSINSSELDRLSVILGYAGSGKSMFIRKLFLDTIQEQKYIPILLELRHLKDENLLNFIFKKLFFNKISTSDEISEKMFGSGKLKFILDGFDEVPYKHREYLLKEIDDLSKRYDKSIFCITSRPEVNLTSLPSFSTYKLSKLNNNDIEPFVKKQLAHSEEEQINVILNNIDKCDEGFKEYFDNPLMLSMYILTFKYYPELPNSKKVFYEQVFETLYSRHDALNKLSFNRNKVSGLRQFQFQTLLEYFCYLSLKKGDFVFSRNKLSEYLNSTKIKKEITDFEVDDVIEDLVVSINIIYKDGNYYSFPHKSLQEYFSACFINKLNEKNKKIVYDSLSRSILNENEINLNYLLLLKEFDELNVLNFLVLPLLKETLDCKDKLIYYYHGRRKIDRILNFINNDFNYTLKSLLGFFDNSMNNNSGEFIINKIKEEITRLEKFIHQEVIDELDIL